MPLSSIPVVPLAKTRCTQARCSVLFRYITLYVTDTLLSSQLRVSTEMYCSVSEWNEMWYTPQRWDLMSWASSSQNAIWDIVLLRAFMRSIKATNGYSPFNRYSKHETVFAYILQFISIGLTTIQFIWNWYARWRLILLCKSTLHMWVGGTPCTAHSHNSRLILLCHALFDYLPTMLHIIYYRVMARLGWRQDLKQETCGLCPRTWTWTWVQYPKNLHKEHVCGEAGYALTLGKWCPSAS